MTRQEELEREGWQRMTTIDEPRLSELVELYRQLGHEVHLEPMHVDEEPGCQACIAEAQDRYRTIYIRAPAGTPSPDLYGDSAG